VINLFGYEISLKRQNEIAGPMPESTTDSVPTISVDQMASANSSMFPAQSSTWGGDKFFGGFGPTKLFEMDYRELRARSSQLFTENLYARGLIRRLVTNEINTGLCLEATPDEETLGLELGTLTGWSEDTERRWELWGNNPLICDYKQEHTWPKLQKIIRRESLIEGDILVVTRMNEETNMPAVQLVSGSSVQTPYLNKSKKIPKTHTVKHGVEKDKRGRIVAYWIQQDDGGFERLPAFAKKTGRRMAWLVYGTDKRKDAVRGEPMLALILQSLKEIDRYRDSVQRRAVIQSILAMFISKGENKPGTLPMTSGAVKKTEVTPIDGSAASSSRTINVADQVPGFIAQELQHGEIPHSFGMDGGNLEFGVFEEAMVRAIAWANEVPPEILQLSFSNNYSASQAAINEFKIYLNPVRQDFGQNPCQYVYVEWLISEALLRKITAPGLLESWRDPAKFETFGAWTAADWSGAIKPSTDILKQAKGYTELVNKAWITHGRASRELTGTKFEKNVKKLGRENELLVKALEPLAKFREQFPASAKMVEGALTAQAGGIDTEEFAQQVAESMQNELTTQEDAA